MMMCVKEEGGGKDTDRISSLHGNADALREESASPLVSRGIDQTRGYFS